MNTQTAINERHRVNALSQLQADKIIEDHFLNNITDLAAKLCEVEFAAVTVIDSECQHMIAKTGLNGERVPRKEAFCNHTIQGEGLFQITDASVDPDFRHYKFVTEHPYIRFYAGFPLKMPEGHKIGALCVLSSTPKELNPMQEAALKLLAEATTQHFLGIRDHKQLKNATTELRNFFKLAPDLLCILNKDGYFTKVSAAFIHKLGYSETELVSNRFTYFIHTDDLARSNAAFDKLRVHAEKVSFFRNRFRTKSGRYIWLSWNAIPDLKTGLIYATGRDITEVKKLEHELEQQHLQKQKASDEKLTQLTNLTGTISAEIMKPLNLSLGFTDLSLDLVTDLRESPSIAFGNPENSLKQLTENLNRIRNYGKNISEIINHMNEIKWQDINETVPDHFKMQPHSVNRICSESLQLALSTFRTTVGDFQCEFSFKLDQRDPQSRINIMNFTKAIISILNNAFEAMMIKSSHTIHFKPRIQVETAQKARNVEIRITNNGIQVPEKFRDKIFNPFFTTKDPGDGLGLGLTISYNIIKSFSGTLALESTNADSTTFKITLPVSYQSLRKVKSKSHLSGS